MAELIFMIFGLNFVQWEEVKGQLLYVIGTKLLSKYILRFVFSKDRNELTKSKFNLDFFSPPNSDLKNTFRHSIVSH